MYRAKVLLIAALVLSSILSLSLPAFAEPEIPIVSYIRTWPLGSDPAQIDLGVNWTAADIQGELLTTINIAFAHLDGNTIFMVDADRTFPDLWEQVAAAQEKFPHLKFNLSVGGWGADGFSDMALSAESRGEFIADVSEWVRKYNLDGIDIDWEYPVGPEWGQEIKSRPEDADNYVALLAEMRSAFDKLGEELGKHIAVTTAVPASTWFPGVIDLVAVQEHVDYLKLMGYDYYGAWSATTGHLANLYNNPEDPEWGGWSTDQAVNMYLDAGVLPEKILMGVPFYGRAWDGVEDENDGLFQPYANSIYDDGLNFMDLQAKILPDPEFVRYWDDVAKAPFLYNGDVFITYEDQESLGHKAAYIKEKGLTGIMIWEYGHDLDAVLLKSLYDSLHED